MNNETTHHKIKQICLELLTRSELTQLLLVRKLSDRGYTSETVLQVIDELAEQGWQSDQRYTEQYIAMRSRKGFGPLRIQIELEQRGIKETEANRALSELRWEDFIAKAYLKKFDAKPIQDWPERARRMRFLHYRGFTTEQINDFMQTLNETD